VSRVLIVEDVDLTRRALTALLESVPDVEVAGETGTGEQVLPIATTLRPDVVMVNNELFVGHVLPILARLQAALPECAVLVLADPRKSIVPPPAGSADPPSFVANDVSADGLVDSIRRVAAGERLIDQRIALASLMSAETVLTTRELEVLGLAADGASVTEIASRLYLSLGTVRNYISKVIGKTGARNRIDAIRIAREAGWLT